MHAPANITIRNKRQTYLHFSSGSTSRDDSFLLEWSLEGYEHRPRVGLCARLQVEAFWAGERIDYRVTKCVRDIYKLDRANAPGQFSVNTDEELLSLAEQCLTQSSRASPTAVLQLLEVSRWTFASENLYEEQHGPKIKEGALEKASGGYESYNRSRARVVAIQVLVVILCLTGYLFTGREGLCFSAGLLTIALLSFAHWSYFRLNAIDATCVLPCLFFPPVGPILIIAWSVVSLLFEKKDRRWFVLRKGHLEMYDSWEGEKREPVGVFLFERQTEVIRSKFYNNQLSIITPYRRLRLWAPSRAERDDWVELLRRCARDIDQHGEDEDSGQEEASAPMRPDVACDFYLDAREYFAAVLSAIEAAKKEVYIAGWMLSPELYLLRDDHFPEDVTILQPLEEEDDAIVFSSRSAITLEFNQVYTIEPGQACYLLAYDLVAPDAASLEMSPLIGWQLRGRSAGVWLLLDSESDVEMGEWDAREMVRFSIGESAKRTPYDAFQICFYAQRDPHAQDDATEDAWVQIDGTIALGGGIRLIALTAEVEAGLETFRDVEISQEADRTLFSSQLLDNSVRRSVPERQTMFSSQLEMGDARSTIQNVESAPQLTQASSVYPGSAEDAMGRSEQAVTPRRPDTGFEEQAFGVLARSKQETRLDRLRNVLLSADGRSSMPSSGDRSATLDADGDEEEELADPDPRAWKRRRGFGRLMSALSWGSRRRSSAKSSSTHDYDALESQRVAVPAPQTPPTSQLRRASPAREESARRRSVTPEVQSLHELRDESSRGNGDTGVRDWRRRVFQSRLDRVIARKVLEGVKFHVLLYRDVELFLPNASASAKKKLLTRALFNKNLQIMRHAPEGRAAGSVQHWLTCSLSRGKTWWSHHDKLVCVDQSVAFVGGLDLAMGRFDDPEHALFDRTSSVWRGKDLYNPLVRDFTQLDSDAFSDSLDRESQPRMPWHDVQCCVKGAAAVDLARRFVARWNAVRRLLKGNDERFTVLIPRSPFLKLAAKGPRQEVEAALQTRFNARCQVLCSVSAWSSPGATEASILASYVNLISSAKESIYIEQQFFSSDLAGFPVRNPIASVLAARIAQALLSAQRFRCIIVLPVIPAFEGELRTNYSARSVLHWNLRSIQGLYARVKELAGVAEVPEEYLGVYALRRVSGTATEQVYVHSKVLVVDDEHAIIGSANLNDRSMLGTRDSEVAVRVSGGDFALTLRRRLFSEHAGVDLTDLFDDRFRGIARDNTAIISQVFPSVPNDSHSTFAHLKGSLGFVPDRVDALKGLQGHLVHYPRRFLSEERNLLPRVVLLEREGAVPFENFT